MVLGVVVGASEKAPETSRRSAASAQPPAQVLSIRLTVSDELPDLSKRALVAEADAIWSAGPIQLDWLTGQTAPGPGANLRVLVMSRAVASAADGRQWAVGELLRFDGRGAIAVASIGGAQRIVDESLRFQWFDVPVPYEHRLGIVLGRAVAHEIGHYLLRTNTHATHGLMRATIDAREFASLRSVTFRLDTAAQAHLANLAARGELPLDLPVGEAFSYPRH